MLLTYKEPSLLMHIEYIINMGASGSIANDLNIGDIVIGKYVVQHDFDITAFGHNKGYITGVGEKVEDLQDFDAKVFSEALFGSN